MLALQGTGVSSGIAYGKLYFYRRDTVCTASATSSLGADAEMKRWENASAEARVQLDGLAEKARGEVGDEAATLFETHAMMLEDLDYTEFIAEKINGGSSAEAAVNEAGTYFAGMFEAMDDDYMRARSADVKDISDRVEGILSGRTSTGISGTEPVIIAADDLTPSETVQLDKSRILGFILRSGSANSHTAILARTLGIPAIIGAGEQLSEENDGRFIVIDGGIGYAVINPDETTRDYMLKKQRSENAVRSMLEKLKGLPDVTLDGRGVKVYANITNPSDTDAVITNDARGIGLFRSEFLYLGRESFPTENEQFEAYKAVVQRMNGQRVIIRTLDIGADKKVDYFALAEEENPALGMRAIRICLSRPEIFRTQLRALYRASAFGRLSIMFPMIASLWEIQEAKRICAAVRKELKNEHIPFDEGLELGVMIETPAAVMIAEDLAREVGFFSIGTNDLTQYTLASDRQGAAGMERFYDAHHPAVLKMIKMTVDAAHGAGIWAGICGELASDLTLTETFLAMGVDELSVSPRFILPLRNAVRGINISAIGKEY